MKVKSNKQRRGEIIASRKKRAATLIAAAKQQKLKYLPFQVVPVNELLLAPSNSYDLADFVKRGYYVDRPFRCSDCGKAEVWTGTQQKWWYEVAKGFAFSTAIRCRLCRRKKREKSAESRRVHLKGLELKQRLKREGSR